MCQLLFCEVIFPQTVKARLVRGKNENNFSSLKPCRSGKYRRGVPSSVTCLNTKRFKSHESIYCTALFNVENHTQCQLNIPTRKNDLVPLVEHGEGF